MQQTKIQEITDKIKSVAIDSGADIVGIASIDAIPDSVPPLPVTKMMPSARSVVVLEFRCYVDRSRAPACIPLRYRPTLHIKSWSGYPMRLRSTWRSKAIEPQW